MGTYQFDYGELFKNAFIIIGADLERAGRTHWLYSTFGRIKTGARGVNFGRISLKPSSYRYNTHLCFIAVVANAEGGWRREMSCLFY